MDKFERSIPVYADDPCLVVIGTNNRKDALMLYKKAKERLAEGAFNR